MAKVRYERLTIAVSEDGKQSEMCHVSVMRSRMTLAELRDYGRTMPGIVTYRSVDDGFLVYFPDLYQQGLVLKSADKVTLTD